MDEASYFADYENILQSRAEVIIAVASGSRAVYKSVDQLQHILNSYGTVKHKDHSKLAELPPCWIDIQFPTVETMVLISRAFGIHTLTMEDCLSDTEDQHQKNELFDTYRFMSFSEAHYIPFTNMLGAVDVHVILPEHTNILISMHNGPVLFVPASLKTLTAQRNELGLPQTHERRRNGIASPASPVPGAPLGICNIPSSYWMMYIILDNIVDRVVQLVGSCTDEVEQLDSLVIDLPPSEQTDLLKRIGESRKHVNYLKLNLMRKQDIIHTILQESKEQLKESSLLGFVAPSPSIDPRLADANLSGSTSSAAHEAPHHAAHPSRSGTPVSMMSPASPLLTAAHRVATIRVFLRDILDHINTMLYDLEQDKETLMNLISAYQAKVSIDMAMSAQDQNSIMKKFSAMATIVLPISLVPALWGMNVPVPGQTSTGHWAFWTIVSSLVGFGIILFLIFWKIKWL